MLGLQHIKLFLNINHKSGLEVKTGIDKIRSSKMFRKNQ